MYDDNSTHPLARQESSVYRFNVSKRKLIRNKPKAVWDVTVGRASRETYMLDLLAKDG